MRSPAACSSAWAREPRGARYGRTASHAPVLGESVYCFTHDPERRVDAEEARRRGGEATRKRSVPDVLRERVEAEADEWLQPYRDLRDNAVLTFTHQGEIVAQVPDYAARVRASEMVFDRVYGKPRQALEHSSDEGKPLGIFALAELARQALPDEEGRSAPGDAAEQRNGETNGRAAAAAFIPHVSVG